MTRTFCKRNPGTETMKSRGFTLVELMVAVTIGLIILGAVAQIFATSRGTYRLEEGLSRVQENGRFAIGFITRDVRMAGYRGCQDQTGEVNVELLNETNYEYQNQATVSAQLVEGYAYVGSGGTDPVADWEPDLPALFFGAGNVLPNTDVIFVRRASEHALKLVAPYMTTEADALTIATPNTLQQWDIVMVASCKGADVFQITSADPNTTGTLAHTNVAPPAPHEPGNKDLNLARVYGSDAEILTLITRAYFIGTQVSTGTGANTSPALFRREFINGQILTSELVDNIESLHLFYGVDNDGDGVVNQFMTANNVNLAPANWAAIASVRIGVLARTPDETGGDWDTNTYDVAGDAGAADDYDPTDDRRQRHVFTSAVNVRNYTQYTK